MDDKNGTKVGVGFVGEPLQGASDMFFESVGVYMDSPEKLDEQNIFNIDDIELGAKVYRDSIVAYEFNPKITDVELRVFTRRVMGYLQDAFDGRPDMSKIVNNLDKEEYAAIMQASMTIASKQLKDIDLAYSDINFAGMEFGGNMKTKESDKIANISDRLNSSRKKFGMQKPDDTKDIERG